MVIYKVTNMVNSKVYIGKTKRTLSRRKTEHYRDVNKLKNKNTYFYNALKKYKKEDMVWEVLDTALTLDELSQKEINWINHYQSCDKDKGYNIKIGGNEYAIKEHRKLTDEERDMLATNRGQKPFIVFNKDGEQVIKSNNPSRIAEVLELKANSAIYECLSHKRDFTNVYVVIYEHEFTQTLLDYKLNKMKEFNNNSYKGRYFLAYNKQTNELIGEFNSIKKASDMLNIEFMSRIADCLKGRQKSTKGFTFKWKDE